MMQHSLEIFQTPEYVRKQLRVAKTNSEACAVAASRPMTAHRGQPWQNDTLTWTGGT